MASSIVLARTSIRQNTAGASASHDPSLFMRGLAFGVGLSLPLWLLAGCMTRFLP